MHSKDDGLHDEDLDLRFFTLCPSQILNSGKLWRQSVSSTPATRRVMMMTMMMMNMMITIMMALMMTMMMMTKMMTTMMLSKMMLTMMMTMLMTMMMMLMTPRLDVMNLQEQLDLKLQQRQARETGICQVSLRSN